MNTSMLRSYWTATEAPPEASAGAQELTGSVKGNGGEASSGEGSSEVSSTSAVVCVFVLCSTMELCLIVNTYV